MSPLDPFDTVTHARLRAEQGDVRGARRVLERILAARPGDGAARDLLASLAGAAQRARAPDTPATLAPPVAATANELALRFRGALGRGPAGPAARLRSLLRRIETARPSNRADGGRS